MDWAGTALTVLGLWYLPKDQVKGFFALVVGNILWLVWAVSTGAANSIIVINLILLVVNSRGLFMSTGKGNGS